MGLPKDETARECTKLGSLAALMVALGYPGEISDDNTIRWSDLIWCNYNFHAKLKFSLKLFARFAFCRTFWALAMVPFAIIVYTLYVGLRDAVESQPGFNFICFQFKLILDLHSCIRMLLYNCVP
jgi:hypothetical protein